jgi:hypothetical protein
MLCRHHEEILDALGSIHDACEIGTRRLRAFVPRAEKHQSGCPFWQVIDRLPSERPLVPEEFCTACLRWKKKRTEIPFDQGAQGADQLRKLEREENVMGSIPDRPASCLNSHLRNRHDDFGRGKRSARSDYGHGVVRHGFETPGCACSGGPAHRPFRSLLGVHSRCGPHTRAVTYMRRAIRKASAISSPPRLLLLLPAGAFAGWGSHPLESAAFSRRTQIADIRQRRGEWLNSTLSGPPRSARRTRGNREKAVSR